MHCRICESPFLIRRFDIRHYSVFKCRVCHYTQINFAPSAAEINRIYDFRYFNNPKYINFRARHQENTRRLKLLKPCLPKAGSRVLDYGCGTGDFIKLVQGDCDVWGYDVSKIAVCEAVSKNPELSGKITTSLSDCPAGRFDAVVMWDVIEHLSSPRDTLEDVLNLLKTDGFLILSTPNSGSKLARLMGRYWAFMTPPEHLGFFDKQTIHYCFEKLFHSSIISWQSRGKWVSLAFLWYKIGRILFYSNHRRQNLMTHLKPLHKISVYVPSRDIQYVVVRNSKIFKVRSGI
ncbi:MAG: class I SAM-dependent methyltransferase [Deltaproteobacteria bacterium]|nr:class I SAM-dependent methyltransferase [Deltaproteobacteria bacterium]